MAEILRLSNDVADAIHENIHKVLLVEDINFTGNLDKSFFKDTKAGFVFLASDNPYAIPVDRGMPAGTIVNFDALFRWVQGKLGISDDDEAREVTFKIRNKIITKGIAPTRFIKKSIRMFIMKHGVISPRQNRTPSTNRTSSKAKKVIKYIKKATRTIKKFNKGLRKISKFLNRVKRLSK